MNIFSKYETVIDEIIGALIKDKTLPKGLDSAGFVVEPPRDAGHGKPVGHSGSASAPPMTGPGL